MNSYLKFVLLIVMPLLLFGCDSPREKKGTLHTYTVVPKPLHKTLHFTGSVQPLSETSLSSPMEAVVETMPIHYGQRVKKGEIVVTLNSAELQKSYNDNLTDYLKAKDSYSIAKAKFIGTQELWDAGLLSKNNYLSEKSSVETARVTLMQATRKLTEMLEKMDDKTSNNLSSLSLADFDKLREILTSNHQIIHLKAPSDGIMLYPPKGGEDKTNRITVGSAVKSGQVIALIGNLQGISVEIDVPEIDIDKIKPGMEAIVSGVAFGKYRLKGKLVAINAQASSTGSNGLPSFTAVVEVNSLSNAEQQWIKVGMSAAIELQVENQNQLLVPMAAIKREQNNSVVKIQLAKGTIEKRVVTTGSAQEDTVVVETGLKPGDIVVYD